MMKVLLNRGLLITFLLAVLSCYLIYILWAGHSHRSHFKSNIIDLIDESVKQTVITHHEESRSVDKEEVLINETSRSIWKILKCNDREFQTTKEQNGDFYLLRNYIKADHGSIRCDETITISTFGDYTFLDNIVPLVERWLAPVSLALYAPGSDFNKSLSAIMHWRNCNGNSSELIKKFVTFHMVFESNHIPGYIPFDIERLETSFQCDKNASLFSDKVAEYKQQNNLTFPINVLRNIARRSALTHFVFASDIELYPSVGLVDTFLDLIMRNPSLVESGENNAFFLPVFEIQEDQKIPKTKYQLQKLFREKKAQFFHKKVCSMCHSVPKDIQWISTAETPEMTIYASTKRQFKYRHWEPFFIGTNNDPGYDERLTWEGKFNKMTQAYTMCLQDYNFLGLSNAFMVHKPGIKTIQEAIENRSQKKTIELVRNYILPQIDSLYGKRSSLVLPLKFFEYKFYFSNFKSKEFKIFHVSLDRLVALLSSQLKFLFLISMTHRIVKQDEESTNCSKEKKTDIKY